MGKIWLVACGNGELALVREEIAARDARARFLRFDGVEALMGMFWAFVDEVVGVAFCSGLLGEAALMEALRAIACSGRAEDLFVFDARTDPSFIARCFEAGATEVIAAGDAAPADISEYSQQGCMGKGLYEGWEGDAPAGDDDERYRGLAYNPDIPPWVDDFDEPLGGDAGAAPEPVAQAQGAPEEAEAAPEPAPAAGESEDLLARWQQRSDAPAAAEQGGEKRPQAPMVAVVSGCGGCGKTTLVATMAVCAAHAGLRTAVLDLDLMFGNLYSVLGAAGPKGIEGLRSHAVEGEIVEADIEGSAMKIGAGLTLWGPCERPEHAELMTSSIEQLIGTLREAADVIFVDTSVQWGDTVAMAVAACDRCVVVGTAGASSVGSTKRAMDLAGKLGVPTTRMTGVFNRFGARNCGEDQALHFEIGVSLRSRVRIADGGEEVASMLSFKQVEGVITGSSAFARTVRAFTSEMLKELGCPINGWLLDEEQRRAGDTDHGRLRIPWLQKAGEVR